METEKKITIKKKRDSYRRQIWLERKAQRDKAQDEAGDKKQD